MTVFWWHWLVFGLVLTVAETATTGGFFIIFFGLGAVAVGILSAAGVAGPLWMQILLFSILSVGALTLFRTRLLRWMQADPQAPAVDTLIGEVAIASQAIAPGAVGKAELRGSTWSARNISAATVFAGARCEVIRVDGLTLDLVPEGVR